MEKGQLCYIIINNDIKPAEFIENSNSWTIHVKNLEDEEEQWIDLCYVCTTKEEAYTKFGFGSKTGITLPDEANGSIKFNYATEIATAAFGQGITTTPIQNIQALTSIANDGMMLKPYIVDKIVDPNTNKVMYQGGREEIRSLKLHDEESFNFRGE